MKTKDEIDFIYEKLSELYPNYSNKKPKAKRLGIISVNSPVNKVPNQLNILIPVGIAITEVVAVK